MPRAKDPIWEFFNCTVKPGNTGMWATCKRCGHGMQGIVDRLKKHKDLCSPGQPTQGPSSASVVPTEGTSAAAQAIQGTSAAAGQSAQDTRAGTSVGMLVGPPPRKIRKGQQPTLSVGRDSAIIQTSPQYAKALSKQWAKYFYATSTPFRHVEHKQFIESCNMMRPGYKPPNRQQIGGHLLEENFVEIRNEAKTKFAGQTVCMALDGWSNVHNDPIVCCSITNMYGNTMLAASVDTSGNSHTGEYLTQLALKAISDCEADFEVNIRSFVTDNTGNVSVLRRNLQNNTTIDIIQYGCSAHIINLLAQDVTLPSVQKDIVKIAKIDRMVPIAIALDRVQRDNSTIAVAFEIWNHLNDQLKDQPNNVKEKFKSRRKMALSEFHFLANMLDHRFRGQRLSEPEKAAAYKLIGQINAAFPAILMAYVAGDRPFPAHMFGEHFRQVDPLTWWRSLAVEEDRHNFKALRNSWTEMCEQYLTATASTAGLERLFSTFEFVQSKLRNRLGNEKSAKLTFMFRHLNENLSEKKTDLQWIWSDGSNEEGELLIEYEPEGSEADAESDDSDDVEVLGAP